MHDTIIQELSEITQSSNVNFLLGAGVSTPFLPLLGKIEQSLNNAKDYKDKEIQYKEYLNKVMLPNKKIINNSLSSDENYKITKEAYKIFFLTLAEILLRRKTTILSKQINFFTTNIDIIMEVVLETLQIEYNDGFSGRLNPTFGLSNFKKSVHQRSLHFEHISEIPVFNIIKIHGSLTWKNNELNNGIIFSHLLEHIDDDLSNKKDNEFMTGYKQILIVNPEETKYLESVLNIYYSELLRLYSSELERENALLFVVGFSMEDIHIKEITLRAAKSNPTLRIFICCSKTSKDNMVNKMQLEQHLNIQILTPEDEAEKYTLTYLTETLLKKVTLKN
jgi:hypothetical protein